MPDILPIIKGKKASKVSSVNARRSPRRTVSKSLIITSTERSRQKADNRPAFQKMITDSAKEQFDVIIVWKLDRFARNRYDSAHYKAILKRNNVRIISATEVISQGPEGIILESLLEGMA